MKLTSNTNAFTILLSAMIGGILAALIVGAGFMMIIGVDRGTATPQTLSATPILDKLDVMTCPRGLSLVTQIRGIEDNYARSNAESAQMDTALRQFGSFDDLYEGRPRTYSLRDFDEIGADKVLLQQFDMPKGAVTGTLFLRLKGAARGADNDYVRFLSSSPNPSTANGGAPNLTSFAIALNDNRVETTSITGTKASVGNKTAIDTGLDRIIAIKLDAFTATTLPQGPNIFDHFKGLSASSNKSGHLVTLGIYDDTAVDAAALALCVEPNEKRGVTFVEDSQNRAGPELSLLSCALDETQSTCNPYTGDTLCTQALPLACYMDGASAKPASLTNGQINDANFVGGQVRATQPILGDRFATIGDANSYCAAEFGAGWRVLTYQEGGGGVVISRSQIPQGTRLWIDIRDQPRARCWDRPD